MKAGLYLSECHRRICVQRLFRLYRGLISSLRVEWYRSSGLAPGKGEDAPNAKHIADLDQLRRELEGVRETYERVGLARGQAHYVFGAVVGTLVIVAVAAITAAILVARDQDHPIWLGAFALAGGAIGAVLSVLERLTRGELRVEFEADRPVIFMGGISRPIVGALSGMALFVLAESRIVPLAVDATGSVRDLFFAGIAFLAGFSERFAKDVFGNAARSLPETSKHTGQSVSEGGEKPQTQATSV